MRVPLVFIEIGGFQEFQIVVISPISSLGSEATVAELIDQASGCWNSRVIDDSFLHFEAQ